MTQSGNLTYLAIDGGGSTCRMVLTTPSGCFVHVGGAANVNSDRSGAIETLAHGLQALALDVGMSMTMLRDVSCYAGLAGVLSEDDGRTVATALGLTNAVIEEDRRAAVVGALGLGDGGVAALGTGSFVALQQDMMVRSIGGHGAILGDEGSGAWIGKTVLARVLHVMDGLRPPTSLSEFLMADHPDGASGVIAFAQTASAQDFGKLAPAVVDAAKAADPLALEIMQDGARYIAKGLVALGYAGQGPLCLMGGVGPHYAPYLPEHLHARVTKPKGTPLDGAKSLARRLAEENAHV